MNLYKGYFPTSSHDFITFIETNGGSDAIKQAVALSADGTRRLIVVHVNASDISKVNFFIPLLLSRSTNTEQLAIFCSDTLHFVIF